VFNLYKNKSTLDEHRAMYQKILNRSIGYDNFFGKNRTLCQSYNPILKNLVGKWYVYMYGTEKLWVEEISISKDGVVDFNTKNGIKGRGEIIQKSNQSIILIEDRDTKQLISAIFDHHNYKTNYAFIAKVIGKQFNSNFDIFTTAILSHYPIKIDRVKSILGREDEARVLENISIQKRLKKYLAERFYKDFN
jgi:hypothetical protein